MHFSQSQPAGRNEFNSDLGYIKETLSRQYSDILTSQKIFAYVFRPIRSPYTHFQTYPDMDSKRIVLITGANTGLGLEMVRSLYSSDKVYEILLGGRSLDKASAAADTVAKDFSASLSRITPVQIDIEDDDSIQSLFNEVQTKFGRLDVLVNNAGILIINVAALIF